MFKKILLIAVLTVFSAQAYAQTAAGATSSQPKLSGSDEDFLSEMPDVQFPGMIDTDGDGVADNNVADMIPTGTDGIAPGEPAEPQKTVKYVYKPGSDTHLRRLIQDPRIEDGYVQGLMQQRGPAE